MIQTKKNKWISPAALFTGLTLLFAVFMLILSLSSPKGNEVLWFASKRTESLNILFRWITRLGEEHIFIGTVVIFLFISYRNAISFAISGIFSLVVAFILKSIFSLPRPLLFFNNKGITDELGSIEGYEFHSALTSFPSGHTMGAFCFFFLITLISRNYLLAFIGFILASAVGISRIYLGQHFSADVSAGSLIGIAIAAMAFYLTRTVWKDRKSLDASLVKL